MHSVTMKFIRENIFTSIYHRVSEFDRWHFLSDGLVMHILSTVRDPEVSDRCH